MPGPSHLLQYLSVISSTRGWINTRVFFPNLHWLRGRGNRQEHDSYLFDRVQESSQNNITYLPIIFFLHANTIFWLHFQCKRVIIDDHQIFFHSTAGDDVKFLNNVIYSSTVCEKSSEREYALIFLPKKQEVLECRRMEEERNSDFPHSKRLSV